MKKQTRKVLFFCLLLSVSACFASKPRPVMTGEMNGTGAVNKVVVDPGKPIHLMHPDFWGTNLLFWVDDDASLQDGEIVRRLKEYKIRMLRYPGGTVADNFHWSTNKLDNVHMFPYEEGESQTDFEEFMQICRKTGAVPGLVVNTETWAVRGDIPGGAHEAAEWLRYCRKKGYEVKDWEIGNETYWHPVMTAAEYADLVNIYADSLKAVDPSVLIGVNGHWDINFVGTRERIRENTYDEVIRLRRNINSKEDYKRYKDFVDANKILPVTTGDSKWWPTIVERCGHHVDMIVVHWYFSPEQLGIMSQKLSEVRNLFTSRFPGKSFVFNMSEYNTTQPSGIKQDEHLYLTEAIGTMLKAKVDIASFWPMRLQNYNKSTLLKYDNQQTSVLYQIYRQLSTNLKGPLVEAVGPAEIPAYASYDGTSGTLVLTGSKIDKTTPVTIRIKGDKKQFSSCSVWRITGQGTDYRKSEEVLQVQENCAVVDLGPLELVVAVFK